MGNWNFNEKPVLVFWETTLACKLKCKHCRAAAIPEPPPDQLSPKEGLYFIDQVADFGRPYPILILTGGDVLMRQDLFELIDYANAKGITVAASPSVTPLLTTSVIKRFKDSGVSVISLSLDGAMPDTHDGIRGVPGTWEKTIEMLNVASATGIKVQINTTVMASNIKELPRIFQLIKENGSHIWEVFFLIHSGRGTDLADITANEAEEVMHFLYHASFHGLTVRTVEAPFFRRVVLEYKNQTAKEPGSLGRILINELHERMVEPESRSIAHTMSTRDGKGIIFINYRGEVFPSGFFPLVVGNVRQKPLKEIYQNNPLLVQLRKATTFKGRCGVCEYMDICGGARARAFAQTNDPFEEDPACIYLPPVGSLKQVQVSGL